MYRIQSPLQQFFDLDGKPLESGSVYFGVSGSNPETTPISVFWDESLTLPAAQPLKTRNGFFYRSGTPANVYPAVNSYSLLIKDKHGRVVFYGQETNELGQLGADLSQLGADLSQLGADLAATGGAALIGTAEGTNVQLEIDAIQSDVSAVQAELEEVSTIAIKNYNKGIVPRASSILILGDSVFGSGIGASAQNHGLPWMLARSILNSTDHGEHKDRGKLYHIQLNAYPSGGGWTEQGVTTGGGVVPVANTVSNYCYSVPAGGWIEITNRKMQSVDVFYDAALSTTGTMTTTRNGVTVSVLPITNGTGVVNTLTLAGSANYLRPDEGNICTYHSDIVRLTFSQPCRLKSIVATQQTYEIQPFVTVCGREGGALDNYIYASFQDELAAYLNFNALTGTNGRKLMIIGLGLNDIYFRRYSPTQYVAYLNSLIAAIAARATNVNFMFMAPFEGDDSRLPALGITIPTAYPYADYISALETYCSDNDVTLIRTDKDSLYPSLLVDGLHPPSTVHADMCRRVCDTLGIQFDPSLTVADLGTDYDSSVPVQFAFTYNSTWRAYLGSSTYNLKARKRSGRIELLGLVEPNGSGSTIIGTLPVGARPIGRIIWLEAQTTVAGTTVMITIDTSGVITTSAIPASNIIIFDGLGFEISTLSTFV